MSTGVNAGLVVCCPPFSIIPVEGGESPPEEEAMGIKKESANEKEPVGERTEARRKLKLNKETVKDLSLKEGTAQAVKGAAKKLCTIMLCKTMSLPVC